VTTVAPFNDHSKNPPVGVWTHVAVVRQGSNGTIFLDGNPAAMTSAWTAGRPSSALLIGHSINTPDYHGYLSDVRVTRGHARYTSAFVPPVDLQPCGGLVLPSPIGSLSFILPPPSMAGACNTIPLRFTSAGSQVTFPYDLEVTLAASSSDGQIFADSECSIPASLMAIGLTTLIANSPLTGQASVDLLSN
jgi:hypothetical protein